MSRKTIYLEDAIDAICKACSMETDYHKCDGYQEDSTWCDYLVALRDLPSAQPEQKNERIFIGYGTYKPDVLSEYLRLRNEKLPSAQLDTICEYCHEDFDSYIKPIEKNGHAFIHFGMNGWCIELQAKGWHGDAKINFCPMCGRRLTDGRSNQQTGGEVNRNDSI